MIAPHPGRVPSATLPLRYLIAAAAAFLVATLGVPMLSEELAGHYYHPRLLALTHTVTLGWITLAIMGASYQLIPVVLERPLWSERLARWQFPVFVAGVIGMVGHFAIGEWSGLLWGAGLVGLAVGAHLLNAALTVRGLARWTFTARLVALALGGLALTAAFGLALGADKLRPFLPGSLFANLHAHVHLALLGWVVPMVIGVAARVYPMFLLAREPGGWGGWLQLGGLAAGVPLVTGGLVTGQRVLLVAGAVGVAATMLAHLGWVVAMVRRRRRPALDWGLRIVLSGAGFALPALGLGLALALDVVAGPRWALAYAVLAFGGWVSLTIAGMMLKIVPFLVWYRAYAPRVGRSKVPAMTALSPARLERAAFALLVPGVAALAVAVGLGTPALIQAAGALVAAGALAFGAALGAVLRHLRAVAARPAAAPLAQERVS